MAVDLRCLIGGSVAATSNATCNVLDVSGEVCLIGRSFFHVPEWKAGLWLLMLGKLSWVVQDVDRPQLLSTYEREVLRFNSRDLARTLSEHQQDTHLI